jgi:hypothetical protein
MKLRQPIGNGEDSNPAAVIVGCSDLSLRKSEKVEGEIGTPPPPPQKELTIVGEACQTGGGDWKELKGTVHQDSVFDIYGQARHQ